MLRYIAWWRVATILLQQPEAGERNGGAGMPSCKLLLQPHEVRECYRSASVPRYMAQ